MNRIESVMVMHSRYRMTWFLHPWIILGLAFAVALVVAVLIGDSTPVYSGAVFAFYLATLADGVLAVNATFRFAVGFSVRRRDYLLGTIAMAIGLGAVWAILLVLLSLIEANLIPHWGVNLYFFHFPYFSDGSPVVQFWVYFALLLFNYFLGIAVGSVYQRLGQTGTWVVAGALVVLLGTLSLLSFRWNWWSSIFSWLGQQSAASLALWLMPLIAMLGLASYALLRKASV
jgi:hypothetical protein